MRYTSEQDIRYRLPYIKKQMLNICANNEKQTKSVLILHKSVNSTSPIKHNIEQHEILVPSKIKRYLVSTKRLLHYANKSDARANSK